MCMESKKQGLQINAKIIALSPTVDEIFVFKDENFRKSGCFLIVPDSAGGHIFFENFFSVDKFGSWSRTKNLDPSIDLGGS